MSGPAALNIAAPPEWMAEAVCAQVDPELFYPEKGGSTRAAKSVCLTCSVWVQCLEYALAHDERFGIWGGTSERERHRLRTATPGGVVWVPAGAVA